MNREMNTEARQGFSQKALIEGIPVHAFPTKESLIRRILFEIEKPRQSFITYLNVHGANIAEENPAYKAILQQSDVVFCDGAGIVLASHLLDDPLPARLPVMDWIFDLLEALARANLTIFFLAGEPGVAERALAVISRRIPHHTVVGVHHGYVLNDSALEEAVIEHINELSPDILLVGFGMPLQEIWVDANRRTLQVKAIVAVGAALDYIGGKIPRCPDWMGKMGMEWLFRLQAEPQRLFTRYMVGNPRFLNRILLATLDRRFKHGLERVSTVARNLLPSR